MHDSLLKLIKLQETDSQLMEIEELKGDLPSEVARLDKELDSLREGISNSKLEAENHGKEVRRLEALASDQEEVRKKYQDQLLLVSTNRAYDALMAEIDTAKQSAETDGMQALELQEKIQQITEQVKADEIALVEKSKLFATRQKSLQQTIAETEVEAKRLMDVRTQLVSEIDEDMYENYERIRSAHDGQGAVEISRGSCGNCFSEVPAQLAADIRAMEAVIACPTCGVMLFYASE